jgi:hypothetical protein
MTDSSGNSYILDLADGISVGQSIVAERKSHPILQVLFLGGVSKTQLETTDYVRLNFMILKIVSTGFAAANYDPDSAKKKNSKPQKREAKDNIYTVVNNMLYARSYERVGLMGKGDTTEDGACVVPGMVFSCTVFKDKEKAWQDIFTLDADGGYPEIPAFSQATLMFASRSSNAKSTISGNLFNIKSVKPLKIPYVFSGNAFVSDVFAHSMDNSVDRRIAFMDSDQLSIDTKQTVKQTYIQNMLSQTRHVFRFKPTLRDSDIGRNADGSLYIHVRNGLSKFGADVSRIRLHDPHDFLSCMGVGDWVENLLRFALSRGAMSVVFTYDSMSEGSGIEAVDGFCMISFLDMMSMCVQPASLVAGGSLPEELQAALFKNGDAGDYDIFADDVEKDDGYEFEYHVVVSKRQSVNPNEVSGDSASWAPILFHPKSSVAWTQGRLVRIYNRGELVLYLMTCGRFVQSVSVLSDFVMCCVECCA